MFRFARVGSLIALISAAAFAMPQGSAGGYGQGGAGGSGFGGGGLGGGGFGGGGNGFGLQNGQDQNSDRRPEDEAGIWDARSAVLTPGDRVEYKFKLRKGETLLSAVSSDAFDPALAMVDAKGVEVAKNDDREEGDQSPFLIYRAPEAGTYTLKVLSYRSVSGGKFALKSRTMLAADAPLGVVVHEKVVATNHRISFRLVASKGRIYDLRNSERFFDPVPVNRQLIRIIGPTGVEKNDFRIVATPDNSAVFEALADGSYYAEYRDDGETKLRTDYREVATVSMKSNETRSFPLEKGELKLVVFPVRRDLIVRTNSIAPNASYLLDGPRDPEGQERRGDDTSYGTDPRWSWFRINENSDADVVRVFHGEGEARYAVRSNDSETQNVTIKNSESLPAWESGSGIKDSLEIGESKLYLVKSSKSEFMRVFGSTTHFQLKMDIFRLNGELANFLMDRKTHTVHDDLYYPEAGTFVVRISCEGFGGSGDYAMLRQPPKSTPYTLGQTQTMKLDGSNFFLYTVNLEADKRYELITDIPQQADLLEDDGTFLTSPRVYFDKIEVQYFTPKKSGPHRLWLRGEPALVHFKLQLNVPPSVGK